MEQENPPAPTSPFTEQPSSPHHHRRLQQPARPGDTRTSPDLTPQPDEPLATSEPSLRFPRPVGSSHLAKWISTSDPDIMRVESHPTDDTGLAGSTYELVSGVDDVETWSQDGNDNDDFASESAASSFDIRRADDVQSFAGTEQLSDDDFTPVLGIQVPTHPRPSSDLRATSPVPNEGDDDLQPESESESGDDTTSSRSSLEYTQQSLRTPSLSALLEGGRANEFPRKASTPTRVREWPRKIYAELCTLFKELKARAQQGLADRTVTPVHPAFLAIAAIQLLILAVLGQALVSYLSPTSWKMPGVPSIPSSTQGAAQVPTIASSTQSSAPSWPLPTSQESTSLTLREDDSPPEWFFASKKPEVSFSSVSARSFLAHIPEDVMETWTSNACVDFTALRNGQVLDTTSTAATHEGLIITFPRREAYGIVDIVLEATCKPGIRKVVKVRFGKGAWDAMVQLYGQISAEVVPEAERLMDKAMEALAPVRDSVRSSLQSASDYSPAFLRQAKMDMDSLARQWYGDVRTHLERLDTSAYLGALQSQTFHLVRNAQTNLQLDLLNAQISAKIAWLSLVGKTEQRDEYRRKAAVFMEEKLVAAEAKRTPRPTSGRGEGAAAWPSWWEYLDPRFQPGEIFACE